MVVGRSWLLFSQIWLYQTEEIRESIQTSLTGECSDKSLTSRLWYVYGDWRSNLKLRYLFIRRLTYNSTTAHNLRKRGIIVDTCCQTCGFMEESTIHVFLQCWWAKCFWTELGVLHTWEQLSFDDIGEWVWFCVNSFHPDMLNLVCICAYMIWRNRNLISHNRKGFDIYQISAFTKCRAIYYVNPIFKFSVLDEASYLDRQAPKGKVIKFNCDASWLKSFSRAGLGCAMRDSSGTILGSGAAFEDEVFSNLDAEGLVIVYAVRWASNLKLKKWSFKTDCAESFNQIQGFSGWSTNARSWTAESEPINVKWEMESFSDSEGGQPRDGWSCKKGGNREMDVDIC